MSELEACPVCGVTPERCSLCTDPARYFLEADVLTCTPGAPEATRQAGTVYFCDRHADCLLSDALRHGDADVELGLYCPNLECPACDSWE